MRADAASWQPSNPNSPLRRSEARSWVWRRLRFRGVILPLAAAIALGAGIEYPAYASTAASVTTDCTGGSSGLGGVFASTQNTDATGLPYLTNKFVQESIAHGTTNYTFSIVSNRPPTSSVQALTVCGWNASVSGDHATVAYRTLVSAPRPNAVGKYTVDLAAPTGPSGLCVRARFQGLDSVSGAFTDYSELIGAPNGTFCSVGSESSLSCIYVGPQATLNAACLQQRSHFTASRTAVPETPQFGCNTWGVLTAAKSRSSYYFQATFYEYTQQSGGWKCFYLSAINNSANGFQFDFDDQWTVKIAMWVCGGFRGRWANTDRGQTGPPADGDTPAQWYGSCGGQADDAWSYAYINGVSQGIPYLSF
jgi:hypothetical protein